MTPGGAIPADLEVVGDLASVEATGSGRPATETEAKAVMWWRGQGERWDAK